MSNVESSGSLYPRMCKENAQIPLTTYIPSEGDTQMAHIVSLWTQNPNMLPKRPNEISTFFEDGRSVVILDPNGRVAGHAADHPVPVVRRPRRHRPAAAPCRRGRRARQCRQPDPAG